MRRLKALVALVGLLLPLCVALSTSLAAAADPAYSVFVGYADDLRSGPSQSPSPWAGAVGVMFEGTASGNDAGAIRVANATAVTETVDFVNLEIGGCTFDLWSHNVALPAGGQLILTQTLPGAGDGCTPGTITGPSNMDTSDIGPGGAAWAGHCNQSWVIPQVTVSVNGIATTYADSGQVLNTNGVDAASCDRPGFPAGNETTQWVSIGEPPCPEGAVLTLTPASQTDNVGDTATINATYTSCLTPLQGATVNFTVIAGPNAGHSGSAVVDPSGHAAFSYSSAGTGTDTVQASVTTLAGPNTSNTVTVTWQRRPTTLVYNGAASSDFNDPAAVSATLTDATTGNPISGATVTFTLNGSETCVGTTNAAGTTACSINPQEPPGTYAITASYGGSATNQPSSISAPFMVTQEESSVTSTSSLQLFSAGGTATLSSTLTDPDGGAPIAGKTVTMTLGAGGSAQSCSVPTNASGVATCSISPVAVPLGPQPVTDTFAGDQFYRSATNAQQALVFAFSRGGSFVIGDQSQTGTVTFWGAQWAKVNSLSGGSAPSSFKGFEDTPAVGGCGTAWTTDPGNSTPPPAGPLPSYMAVVVASSVSKSGSNISGNSVHVVIVRTDPGYAANPGHAGTGQVVATLC
ncbi:MAG: hypothetical protein QOJ52_2922 [Acidimicrobiaceae bacterium]|nr:hypothetical protein [Acidimicrobiaceae bacterium]